MMEEVIGSKGIAEREIEGIRPRISDVLERVTGRKYGELAFLDLAYEDTTTIKDMAKGIRAEFDSFIALGVGGSALGPKVILNALSPFHNLRNSPRIFICDNADPGSLDRILSMTNPEKTSVNVISKSGTTAETMAAFMVVWEKLRHAAGDRAARNVIATTDAEKGDLRKIAGSLGIRSLTIPAGVVGRYSVLSPVGLLLAEVARIDSAELLRGARDITVKCSEPEVWMNPSTLLSALIYLMHKQQGKNITAMMPYADRLKAFSEWFCQLWAESLGKVGTGITPYPAVGATDQHSQLQLWLEGPEDKIIMFIRVEDYGIDFHIPDVFRATEKIGYLANRSLAELIQAEEESTELVLAQNGRPNITVKLPKIDAYHLGQLFCFFEITTVFTGLLLGINPFNQPGVEESKALTYGLMGRKGYEEKREEIIKAREKKACWKL
jgi:glucose-6-phosphate isomerase